MDMYRKIQENGVVGFCYCLYLALRHHGGFGQKIRFLRYALIAKKEGVIWFRLERIATDYVNAWYTMDNMPSKEKSWYIQHGFNPRMKMFCGVMPENHMRYLSDFEFYNVKNYKNLSSASWFDNKLNTYYLLSPFSAFLPRHYFYVEKGRILPLDVDPKRIYTAHEVLQLLKDKKVLAAKRCYGGHGEGFLKFEFGEDKVIIANGVVFTEDRFCGLIDSLKGYIITDFIKPAKWIRKVAGENSFAVMRVMTIFDELEGPRFERVMMRIGTNKSGPTQAGHDFLYVGIDGNGSLFNCFYEYSDYCWSEMDRHPETGEVINGRVMHNMEDLRDLCISVSGFLPSTPYLIFDVIPTDESFMILEINSHGQPFNFEPFDPVKGSIYFTRLFEVNQ